MSAVSAKRKFPAKAYVLSLVAIALFGLWPIFSVLLTSTLAETYGCVVDEGSVHPCMIGGTDWGEALLCDGSDGLVDASNSARCRVRWHGLDGRASCSLRPLAEAVLI